jgi:hypothetical protein
MCPSEQLVPQRLPHPTTAVPGGARRKETPPLGSRRARVYPPLPRWSGAATQGLYPGRDIPLPAGRRGGTGSGACSTHHTPMDSLQSRGKP